MSTLRGGLLEHELFAFGRLGIPESLQLLLAVAGAGAWLHRRSAAGSVAAGVLFGLATLAKLNVLVLAGFAGMWALETLQRRPRLVRDVLAFTGGVVAVVATWLVAHPLALENRTHPVWYTPARPFNQLLNADLGRFPVRWALTMDGSGWPRADQYPFPLVRVRTFDLLPAPRGGFKVRVELYRRGP